MYRLAFSPSQRLSHAFLHRLSSYQDGDEVMRFAFREAEMLVSLPFDGEMPREPSLEKVAAETATLLIFGEGLNLEKLQALENALSPTLAVYCYQRKQGINGTDGLCLAASVNLVESEAANKCLEKAATQFQVELVYLTKAPSLSQPGLLLMDMDSTVIAVECIDEIAKLAGVGEQVSEVTELAMQGKLDFADSLSNRVACLKDAPESILLQVRNALPLMPGITRLVTELKSRGWKVAIASGGFTFFADYLQERLELDAAIANALEIVDGKLTGNVIGGIVDANVKAHTLERLAQQWQIPADQTIAMGDGANDLVMMDRAALGVAYHAKPIVREKATAAIRFGGLDGLLWMLEN